MPFSHEKYFLFETVTFFWMEDQIGNNSELLHLIINIRLSFHKGLENKNILSYYLRLTIIFKRKVIFCKISVNPPFY